jgi:hypothetical protein
MHSAQTLSSQQFPQRLVKFQHRFILHFDSAEACKQKLLAVGRWVDKVLKEQRQILHIRLSAWSPDPTAPKRLVPPMTEEAIACNSQPSACVAFPMPIRMASNIPTNAAHTAESV